MTAVVNSQAEGPEPELELEPEWTHRAPESRPEVVLRASARQRRLLAGFSWPVLAEGRGPAGGGAGGAGGDV